jgi:hypothetical protein
LLIRHQRSVPPRRIHYSSDPFPISIIQRRAEINVEPLNNYFEEDAIIDDENAYELVHMDNEEGNDESKCDESTEEGV